MSPSSNHEKQMTEKWKISFLWKINGKLINGKFLEIVTQS